MAGGSTLLPPCPGAGRGFWLQPGPLRLRGRLGQPKPSKRLGDISLVLALLRPKGFPALLGREEVGRGPILHSLHRPQARYVIMLSSTVVCKMQKEKRKNWVPACTLAA